MTGKWGRGCITILNTYEALGDMPSPLATPEYRNLLPSFQRVTKDRLYVLVCLLSRCTVKEETFTGVRTIGVGKSDRNWEEEWW